MEILGGKTRPQNHRRRDSAFFVLSFSYYLFSYQAYSLAPTQCLKFKTHSSIFLGRFEALNRSLIQKMTNSPLKPTSTGLSAPPSQAIAASPVTQGANLPETPVPASAPSGGGVKKKKGGKRK